MLQGEWSLSSLPPEGHADVGQFFYELYSNGLNERRRLGLEERWDQNHRLFRGQHWPGSANKTEDMRKVTVNLFFANVSRTVANITAKEPQAEVVEIVADEGDYTPAQLSSSNLNRELSLKMRRWYNETEQGQSLSRSGLAMEVYGITIEKSIWNFEKRRAETVVLDPYSCIPAPGYYDELNDAPYICHAYPMRIDEVESFFEVDGVGGEDVYSILGEQREDNRPYNSGARSNTSNYPSNYTVPHRPTIKDPQYREARALVVEVWVRDHSRVKDEETGEQVLKYPGGIRVVTICNEGRVVLSDMANPMINHGLPQELTSNTYLYDRFPFRKANSYEDNTSIWGFSSAEQVADLNLKIDELLTVIANYLARVMMPILILPKDTGITLDMLSNRPGLVLQPPTWVASQGIRYLAPPSLPSNFMEMLNTYVGFFDRVSQIEDADRGNAPGGVIAASAIVALQERGAVLIRQKIRSMDYLVRERGRCTLSLYQSFGLEQEAFELDAQTVKLRGVDLAGRKFDYVVESGSTVHRTTAQIQEQAEALYHAGAIDRQALLETVNFPKWRQIVERVGEGQLGQALQILQQAGMSQEEAAALKEYLMQPQGGPGVGGGPQGNAGAPAEPGIPTAQQGSIE